MSEASQRMLEIRDSNQGIEGSRAGMNPANKRHLELQIRALQNTQDMQASLNELIVSGSETIELWK